MKLYIYTLLNIFLFAGSLLANERYERIVDISVRIDSTGASKSFVLTWNNKDINAEKYIISRKLKNEKNWQFLDTLDANNNTYTDTPPETSKAYEYGIIKTIKDASYTGYGYVYAGYDVQMPYERGIALLLIDETMADSLKNEIKQFQLDLTGDGYFVITKYVERTEKFYAPAISRTKLIIDKVQAENPNETISLLLLGRVAVPYSGNTAWDGHRPDHSGAWAADVYYGVPRNYWNDFNVLNRKPVRKENKNIPYDGKFDQSVISKSKMRIGRIDMFNLPFFPESEKELLRRYLNKNHNFRHRKFQPRMRAVLDDGFGNYLLKEAIAACAWLNFAALLGTKNIDTISSYRYGMKDSSFLWSYGCNMGAYDNIYHTVYSEELASNPYKSVFTILLGSYAGDWDTRNNVLRATLASKPMFLTSIMAGRPFVFFHQMALGEPIGYSVLVSQNNKMTYLTNQKKGVRAVYMTLLGDPTLRMKYTAPPVNFIQKRDTIISGKRTVSFEWEKPEDDILGYMIFRADSSNGKYKKINTSLIKSLSFTDNTPPFTASAYMLRSVKREIAVTGSYYNLSQGVFIDIDKYADISESIEQSPFKIFPNPASKRIHIRFHISVPQKIRYSLLNIKGKTIFQSVEKLCNAGDNELTIELSRNHLEVQTGIYLIKLQIAEKIYFGKFLIMN